MELAKLFTLNYYFEMSPEAGYLSLFLAVYFLLLFMLRAHLRFMAGKHDERKIVKKLQKKHLKRLAIIGTLGLLTIAARNLDIAFFGMRVFAYALILWSFYEAWAIRQVFAKKVHKVIERNVNLSEADKYKPRPKKKRKKGKRR